MLQDGEGVINTIKNWRKKRGRWNPKYKWGDWPLTREKSKFGMVKGEAGALGGIECEELVRASEVQSAGK